MKKYIFLLIFVLACTSKESLYLTVDMYDTLSKERLGVIGVSQTKYGALFKPTLKNLSPGIHGFHLHENPSCEMKDKKGKKVAGLAAGGHYDPYKTTLHLGPYGEGHLGDLPVLYADSSGRVLIPVLAPRVKVNNLKNKALIIHEGGDNYSDTPTLGGGGKRMVCGVINE